MAKIPKALRNQRSPTGGPMMRIMGGVPQTGATNPNVAPRAGERLQMFPGKQKKTNKLNKKVGIFAGRGATVTRTTRNRDSRFRVNDIINSGGGKGAKRADGLRGASITQMRKALANQGARAGGNFKRLD